MILPQHLQGVPHIRVTSLEGPESPLLESPIGIEKDYKVEIS